MNKSSSKENKIFNKINFTNWIIGGIIALFTGKIMEPLLTYMFSFLLNISGSLMTYISNSTYKEISNGFSEQSASSTLYLVYVFAFVILEFVFMDCITHYKSYKKKSVQIVNPTPMSQDNNETALVTTPSQNSDSMKMQFKKTLLIIRVFYLFAIFIFLLLLVLLIFFYGRNSFIRDKTIAMTNNIEIVSPYISDIEYKQLKSKFHSMENQADFNSLMEELETIASEYSLKLK